MISNEAGNDLDFKDRISTSSGTVDNTTLTPKRSGSSSPLNTSVGTHFGESAKVENNAEEFITVEDENLDGHFESIFLTPPDDDKTLWVFQLPPQHVSSIHDEGTGVFISGEPRIVRPPLQERVREWLRYLWKFFVDYHLPCLLFFGVILGVAWPTPGRLLGDARLGQGLCLLPNPLFSSNTTNNTQFICVYTTISSLCVSFIFFISGLGLKLTKMRSALFARKEIALGLFLIFLGTASFGFAVAAGPRLNPPEFSLGLALFSLMPTTLSSCVIIVGYAGGNVALALLLTVTSNMLAIAILPLTVGWLVQLYARGQSSAGVSVKVDAITLCLSLVFTVLLPLLTGVLLKLAFPGNVGGFVERKGHILKVFSAFFNAVIPWMKISQSAQVFGRVAGADYVTVILAGWGLHLTYLAFSSLLAIKVFKLRGKEEEKTIAFVGAQKTLPVALGVLELLPKSVTGEQGLVAVAMILVYLFQTILDSSIAVRWNNWGESRRMNSTPLRSGSS